VRFGFYTSALATSVRAEGRAALAALDAGTHPCLVNGWIDWRPDRTWTPPGLPKGWDTTPVTHWKRCVWAYGAPPPSSGTLE
jgi:hypothetical protein